MAAEPRRRPCPATLASRGFWPTSDANPDADGRPTLRARGTASALLSGETGYGDFDGAGQPIAMVAVADFGLSARLTLIR